MLVYVIYVVEYMRIGITGFGRIGKLVFRIIEEYRLNGKVEVFKPRSPNVT